MLTFIFLLFLVGLFIWVLEADRKNTRRRELNSYLNEEQERRFKLYRLTGEYIVNDEKVRKRLEECAIDGKATKKLEVSTTTQVSETANSRRLTININLNAGQERESELDSSTRECIAKDERMPLIFTERWPCLNKDSDFKQPKSRDENKFHKSFNTPIGRWYFDSRAFKKIRAEGTILVFEKQYPEPTTFSIDVRDISAPSKHEDVGSYDQRNVDCVSLGSFFCYRVNPYPTLFFNLIVSEFIKNLGRAIIESKSDIFNTEKFHDCDADGDMRSSDKIWLFRSLRNKYTKPRSNERYADLVLNGELRDAVFRFTSTLIREYRFPFEDCKLDSKYTTYWAKIQLGLRQANTNKITLPSGFGFGRLGDAHAEEMLELWAYHCVPMLNEAREFDFKFNFTAAIDQVWDSAQKLVSLKEIIKISKQENCADKSFEGRMQVVSRFAVSARSRISRIQGKEYREYFDHLEWLSEYGEELAAMIFDFQISTPGELFHIDHIVPLAAIPREDWRLNTSLAWHPCNLQVTRATKNISKNSSFQGKRILHSMQDKSIYSAAIKELKRLYVQHQES